jgi:hypothetical protein
MMKVIEHKNKTVFGHGITPLPEYRTFKFNVPHSEGESGHG